MAYITQEKYYENNGAAPRDANWGSYQYVSLQDIVNNFMLMYAGNHSLINNEERYKILFHAKRAIQELNYDAFKQIKVLELTVRSMYAISLFVSSNIAYKSSSDHVESKSSHGTKRNLLGIRS
jgi:hypothetical protein